MSSSPLYLAIVAVWAIVLVPMLLRRDAIDATWIPRRSAPAEGRAEIRDDEYDDALSDEVDPLDDQAELPAEGRTSEDAAEERLDEETETADGGPARPPARRSGAGRPARPAGRQLRRSTVIARRRRRTSGLVLLLLLTAGAVGAGLGPWWVVAPPAVLLVGHLALLREAAKVDAERRRAERRRRARARRAEAERRREEAERKAEVIELASRRRGVYDQYADAQLRAAGD